MPPPFPPTGGWGNEEGPPQRPLGRWCGGPEGRHSCGPVAELEVCQGEQRPICNRGNVGSSPTRPTLSISTRASRKKSTFGK